MRMVILGFLKHIVYFFVVVGCILIALRYIERHSIFFPMKTVEVTPRAGGMDFREVFFEASDGVVLCGWFIPAGGSSATLLLCHGNAGNIGHRLEKIALFHKMGLNVFIFDYRGYGKSKGTPNEKGLYRDGEAAYRYLIETEGISPQDVILYGASLGAAVAIDIASRSEFRVLITEEAFTSMKDMVRIIYPFLPHFILESRLDSISKIRDIDRPKLIIHSVNDEIVPFSLGEKLFDAAAPPKEFLKVRGGHNTAFMDSQELFQSRIKLFIQDN